MPPRTTVQTLHRDYKEISLIDGNEEPPTAYTERRAQYLRKIEAHSEEIERLTDTFMNEGDPSETAQEKARRQAIHPDFVKSDNIAGHAWLALYVRKEIS